MDDAKLIGGIVFGWLRVVYLICLKWPAQLARWLFRVRAEQADAAWLVYQTRFAIGLIIVVSVAFKYDSLDDRVLAASAYKFGMGLLLSLPLYLIMMAIVVFKASNDRPGVMRRLALGPVLTIVGGGIAVVGAFTIAGSGKKWLRAFESFTADEGGFFFGMLGIIADVMEAATIPFGLVFAVCCLYYLWRDMFRAGDGHPLLPPLVAPWMAVMGTIADFANPVKNDIPQTVSAFISISGSVIMIALSIWEFIYLRRVLYVDWEDEPGQL